MTDDIESKLIALIRAHLRYLTEQDELANEADLDSLGLDSVAAMSLLLDLEEAFGIEFPDSYLTEDTFKTPSSLQNAVRGLLG